MATKVKSMMISNALIAEFDHEKIATRKHLERVPEDRLGWKPHEKSFTLKPEPHSVRL